MGIALSAEWRCAAHHNPATATQDAADLPPRHSCECRCASCEARGAGYFAQIAALRGEPQAAAQLSTPVFALLNGMRSGDIPNE